MLSASENEVSRLSNNLRILEETSAIAAGEMQAKLAALSEENEALRAAAKSVK